MNKEQQIETLKYLTKRYGFYKMRFINFKSLFVSASACGLNLPPGIIEKAGETLVDKLKMSRELRKFREEFDLYYMEQKMNSFVLAEKYEKAAVYRDKINQYKEKYGTIRNAQEA